MRLKLLMVDNFVSDRRRRPRRHRATNPIYTTGNVCLITWSKEWLTGDAVPKPGKELIVACYDLSKGQQVSHRVVATNCPHDRKDYICVKPTPNSTLPAPHTIQMGAPLVQLNVLSNTWEQIGIYSNNLEIGGFSNNCKDANSCLIKFIPTIYEPYLSYIHANTYSIIDRILKVAKVL